MTEADVIEFSTALYPLFRLSHPLNAQIAEAVGPRLFAEMVRDEAALAISRVEDLLGATLHFPAPSPLEDYEMVAQ